MKRLLLTYTLILLSFASVYAKHNSQYYLDYATRFADSQMAHDPQLWQADGMKKPKWDYTQALIAKAMLQAYQATGKEKYLKYVQEFADYFIHDDGTIETYKKSDFNIDRVNGGSFLYVMNDIQPEERFQKAIDILYDQLKDHPRTNEGGFWHKKIYPHQMWLDGLYMAEPFYCRYAKEHGDSLGTFRIEHPFVQATFNRGYWDIILQFSLIDRHTYDLASGLNYHGWDESHEQAWSDSITGCSPHFWGRSMGWYVMAMVDVLDNMPKEHPGYTVLQAMLERSAKNLLKYQDKKTHLWYQVLDKQGEAGNYQEATCSAIFCYAFAKAANQGYLPKCYKKKAQQIFDGLVKNLVVENADGTISLTQCCSVAGLGGKPYRSGSYEYYIGEPIRNDDPKGIGPIIFAALELAK